MKIAIDVSRALIDEKTGLSNYQYYLFKNLLKIGGGNEYIPFYYGRSRTPLREFMGRKIVRYRNKFIFKNLALKNLYDRVFIKNSIQKKSINLIHSTAFTTIAGLEDITVVTIHDLRFIDYIYDESDSFTQAMVSEAVKKVRAIIADSEFTKRAILEKFPFVPEDKIKIIYLGVSEYFLRINDPEKLSGFRKDILGHEDIKYILYLGGFAKVKNIPGLIKAYHRIIQTKDIPHKLVLVGKVLNAYQDILSLVDNLGLQDKVIIKKYLSQEHIPYLLSAADAFVFPSFYEGFGLPVLEAMKCGCPCIVSNGSSLKELFFDSAIMVNPHDTGGLAKAIYLLLSDVELQKKYTSLGLKKASQFTWERMAQETLKVYKGIG